MNEDSETKARAVFTLMQGDYEPSTLGVFSTEELALTHVAKWKLTQCYVNLDIVDELCALEIHHWGASVIIHNHDLSIEDLIIETSPKVEGDGDHCDDADDFRIHSKYGTYIYASAPTECEAEAKLKELIDAYFAFRATLAKGVEQR